MINKVLIVFLWAFFAVSVAADEKEQQKPEKEAVLIQKDNVLYVVIPTCDKQIDRAVVVDRKLEEGSRIKIKSKRGPYRNCKIESLARIATG